MRPIDKIPAEPLDSSEIKIGRLMRRIEKLNVHLMDREKQLSAYKQIFDNHPRITRDHLSYDRYMGDKQKISDLETRVREQSALIKRLMKNES